MDLTVMTSLNADTQLVAPVVDSSAEGNSGDEVNNANSLIDSFGCSSLLDDLMEIVATSITVEPSEASPVEILDNDDNMEAAESVAFATSLLNEQLKKISLPNLENTIYIFRDVLEEATPGQDLHSDALRNLIFASGLKYVCEKDKETISELTRLAELLFESGSATSASKHNTEDDELRDMLMLGKAAWDELLGSISPATISTIIYLLRQSLGKIPAHDESSAFALATFSYAMYLQVHYCNVPSGLVSVVSMLQAAQRGQERKNHQLHNIAIVLTATLAVVGKHDSRSSRNNVEVGAPRLVADKSATVDDPGRTGSAVLLLEHGRSLLMSVEENGDMDDLKDSIAMVRLGLREMSLNHPAYSSGLNILASALHARFRHRGTPQDLDESMSLYRQALDHLPSLHPLRSSLLNNLAIGLFTRFQERGDPHDLNESVSLHRQALNFWPSRHPDRAMSLNNLASALAIQFEQRGDPHYINESILLHRQALDLCPSPHPNQSTLLNNFANGLFFRFQQQGDPHDLDESVSLHRRALDLRPSPHPLRPTSLNNVANGLFTRFKQQGDPHDLDESVALQRQALDLLPFPHPDRAMSLNNLASALSIRFEQRRDPHDLDESVSFHRQALDLLASPNPLQFTLLNNLGGALSTRFKQRGNPHDLDESVSLHRQAQDLWPSPHPDRAMSLDNLAKALSIRFKQRGDPRDLDESVSLHRQALNCRPSPHPDRAMSLNSLAGALSTQFEQQGDPCDLNESISFYRQALDLLPPYHPLRLDTLNNLANRLQTRVKPLATDLEESKKLLTESIQLSPINHPSRPQAQASLAVLYFSALERDPLNTTHLDEAIGNISEAAHSISKPPSQRYMYAHAWAQNAERHHHSSALQAYDLALSLLPQLVALGLDIQARQATLSRHADGLAGHAAECAINLGDVPKAVEFLEIGRSVFWSQFLSLRSPLDELEDVSPNLARDLCSISQHLEKGSHRDQISAALSNREKLTLEAEASNYTKLAEDWQSKVDEVRQLEGFQDFLRPKQFSTLQAAAEDGPVIYLVDSEPASHCLVITASDVHHISLPDLPSHRLAELVHLVKVVSSDRYVSRLVVSNVIGNLANDSPLEAVLRKLTEEEDRGMRPKTGLSKHISSDDIFRLVLGVLWDEAVKAITDTLGLTKSNDPPKVTWCTTGLFNFLPIHAAGHYNEGKVDCASEYFISSYSPTIEALLTPEPPSSKSFQMMAVIQSENLCSTHEELKRIEGHVPNSVLRKFGIPGAPATMESVAKNLSTASLVHFACHGKQDPVNPLQSGLQIGGERLTIARIMKESIPNGSLAFLSACETATGDEKIPDEAMNIASSLLFTGFRKVVATMWRMWDVDGPVVADAFYKELFTGPDGDRLEVPDTSKSAKALWIAVNELRSKGIEFRRWVLFIHMGK